jgi:hypothetical protein
MKKSLFTLLCLLTGLLSYTAQAQIISISPGTDFNVVTGTIVSLENLQLTPSANFTLSGVVLDKTITSTNTSFIPTISKYYKFSTTTTAFSGEVVFMYLNAELNGLTEGNLKLLYHNGSTWFFDDNGVNSSSANLVTSNLISISLNEISLGTGTLQTYYLDVDGDGFGSTVSVQGIASTPPAGYSVNNTDCDDANFAINPGATEICYNGIDDNCNSTVNEACGTVVVNMTATTATLTSFSIAVAALPYSLSPYTNLKYRFKITKIQTGQSNEVQEFTLSSRFVTIPQAMRSYTATYTIRAAAVINDEILAYLGNTMTITPPSIGLVTITLSSSSCGATLSSLNATISANPGLNATGYIFRIRKVAGTDPVTGPFFTSSSASRFVGANTFTGLPLEYNGAYKVSLAYTYLDASNSATLTTGYGAECNLFIRPIPTINLVAPTCGTVEAPALVSSMTATVTAAPASGASGYQFRIRETGGATYFTTGVLPSRFTQLSMFGTTLAFSTNYSISVQYYTVINGVSTPSGYGAECHITTLPHPTTQLTQSQCGSNYMLSQRINIIAYPGIYRVKLSQPDPINPEEELVIATRDIVYSYFNMGDFPEAQVGQTYFVSVAVEINGVFGDYGPACKITVISSPTAKVVIGVPFKATAYPNPFANNFMLDVKTTSQSLVNVKVYDMIGRLIEQREVSTSDLETTTIGDRYPSGVYNVVVAQEDTFETVRVVKR